MWTLHSPAGIRVVSSSHPPLHKPTSFHHGQFRTVSLFITIASSRGRATQPYFLTCTETKCNCHRQILVCHTISWLQKWVCLNTDHFTMDPAIKAAYIVYEACQISGNSLVLPHLTFQMTAQTASGFTVCVIISHSLLKPFSGLYKCLILLYLSLSDYFHMSITLSAFTRW